MCQGPWEVLGLHLSTTHTCCYERTNTQASRLKHIRANLASFTVPELVTEPEEGELMGSSVPGRSALIGHKTADSGKGLACSVCFSREVVSGNHGAAHPEAGLIGKNKQAHKHVAFNKLRLFYTLPVSDMASGLGLGSSLSFYTHRCANSLGCFLSGKWRFCAA